MFIVANFIQAIAVVLSYILQFYSLLIIARALISWVSPDPHNPIVRFLYSATEPLLYRVRRALPFLASGIDFSPLVVLLGLMFLQTFLVRSLEQIAFSLQ